MADAQTDKTCTICYEEREDLRMLPCWHVACISCALGMAQTGQGRAVKCHTCREPFLFENIRSLPRPVGCVVCHKIVTSPKKFPCGPTVYCADCAADLPETADGTINCPVLCKNITHCRNELRQAKICPLCFCMHSSEGHQCGHNICSGCGQAFLAQQRNCPLCLAVDAPMPVPVNPVLSPNGNAEDSINDLQALGNGQQISQMQLLSAIQIIGAWRNQQAQRQPAQQQQQRTQRILEKYMAEDLPKLGIATTLFFVVAIIWGFEYWIWAVLTTALCLLRPIKEYSQAFGAIISVLMLLYSLWNYFFYLILFIVIELGFGLAGGVVVEKFFPNQPFFINYITILLKVAQIMPVYYIFPAVFVHISLADVGFLISNYFARPASVD